MKRFRDLLDKAVAAKTGFATPDATRSALADAT